ASWRRRCASIAHAPGRGHPEGGRASPGASGAGAPATAGGFPLGRSPPLCYDATLRWVLPSPPPPGGPSMLNLFPTRMTTCEGIERRAFLKLGALTGLGLSLPALFASRQAHA